MNRLILATLAVTILGAPLAYAANPSAAAISTRQAGTTVSSNLPERCARLDARFDKAKAGHKADQQALALRTEGEALCSSNQQVAGAKYLGSAIKVIDAEPRI